MKEKFLKKENLDKLIGSVRDGGGVFVGPAVDARRVVFREISGAGELTRDYIIPENNYKEWVFPQTEVIARFRMRKDGVDMEGTEINPPETVVFAGGGPGEAESLSSLRAFFTWDFVDEFYTRSEDRLTVITVACTAADDECF